MRDKHAHRILSDSDTAGVIEFTVSPGDKYTVTTTTPDMHWVHVDQEHHEHTWSMRGKTRTIRTCYKRIIDDKAEYACKSCGEVVRPGMVERHEQHRVGSYIYGCFESFESLDGSMDLSDLSDCLRGAIHIEHTGFVDTKMGQALEYGFRTTGTYKIIRNRLMAKTKSMES